ncbi:MAG: DUF3656 domain-containing protein [Eubacteriales bacterium]
MKKRVEILSPAGSFDCLVAALKSGADAIYVGGDRFGARANANNFTLEELKKAIDLVHLHGKQLYLTVNTLLKESEIQEQLYEYLEPLYIHGIDAVIVQDLGVLQFVKAFFPDLPIHASTQMTVTSALGARFLEDLGVERVVTSRELMLGEVKEIAESTKLEIESFVHGALCYSYSGQCLYSSMIGGRSGNRGQCAQPCRLPYKVDGETEYYMSLKDICTLYEIPDLIEAGVFSFKIEGRMKKPEYVASVTAMYRKYVDLYLEKGKANYKVAEQDVDILRDIFNRGDFHSGYWKQYNGKEMITTGKPSHTGVPSIQVQDQMGRQVFGKALRTLNKGDIIEITENGDNYTLGQAYQCNEKIQLSLRKGVILKKGTVLYRTRNQELIQGIEKELDSNKLQEVMTGTLVLVAGCKAALHLQMGMHFVSIEGEVVQTATTQPASKEKIAQQIRKTGNTPFQFQSIEIVMDDNIFVPTQQLNQLRRDGIAVLERTIVDSFRRELKVEELVSPLERTSCSIIGGEIPCVAYVETLEQLEEVEQSGIFSSIYLDCNAIRKIWENQEYKTIVSRIKGHGKKVYIVMPHIFRDETASVFKGKLKEFFAIPFDGIMIRNLESYQFLKEENYKGEIHLDHHVYTYNSWSMEFWERLGISKNTHALELTAKEINQLSQRNSGLVVYGYTPNMISAQCVQKTAKQCTHKSDMIIMKDRMGKDIQVKCCCDYCYNIIYNTCPTSLLDEKEEIRKINPAFLRVDFTVEGKLEVKEVIDSIGKFYYDISNNSLGNRETTKGHFRRGVR